MIFDALSPKNARKSESIFKSNSEGRKLTGVLICGSIVSIVLRLYYMSRDNKKHPEVLPTGGVSFVVAVGVLATDTVPRGLGYALDKYITSPKNQPPTFPQKNSP